MAANNMDQLINWIVSCGRQHTEIFFPYLPNQVLYETTCGAFIYSEDFLDKYLLGQVFLKTT